MKAKNVQYIIYKRYGVRINKDDVKKAIDIVGQKSINLVILELGSIIDQKLCERVVVSC